MNMRTLMPLLIAFLVLLASAGLYGFGYYTLSASSKKVATLSTLIAAKTLELDRADQARAALTTLGSDEAILNQFSLGRADIVPFLEALQTTGKQLGAVVQVLSVSDENTAGHSRISLSLSIVGPFDAVVRTLGAIEYGPYDGVIRSLSLDTTPSGTKLPSGNVWTAASIYSVGLLSASSTPTKP